MADDLFSAAKSTVLAVSSADEALIKFERNSNQYILAALDTQLKYTDDFSFIRAPGNKLIALSKGALGSISIAALMGRGTNSLDDFISYYGSVCNINDTNGLVITLDSGMSCSELTLNTYDVVELSAYQVKLVDYSTRLIQGVLVGVNLQLRFGHLETDYTYSGT